MLLVLASMIAFMGLIENSTVVLVASMLVSPIMGPILAGIFGSVVGDAKWDNQLHVVLLDSTPEIEAFVSLLIYPLLTLFMTSLKQLLEYFYFRCKIHLDHLNFFRRSF